MGNFHIYVACIYVAQLKKLIKNAYIEINFKISDFLCIVK
jgi:hypothetical protein